MFKEKFKDFLDLIAIIFFDSAIIVIVAFFIKTVKFLLEKWIFHTSLENLNNKTVIIVYGISKIFIIASFAIYVAFDIVSQIIKFVKRIKKDKDE